MRAKATKDFKDLEANAFRKAGETFEVTEERFKAINSTRYGTLAVEEVKEAPKKPKTKPKTKRKSTED